MPTGLLHDLDDREDVEVLVDDLGDRCKVFRTAVTEFLEIPFAQPDESSGADGLGNELRPCLADVPSGTVRERDLIPKRNAPFQLRSFAGQEIANDR